MAEEQGKAKPKPKKASTKRAAPKAEGKAKPEAAEEAKPAEAAAEVSGNGYRPRLLTRYREEIAPAVMKEFSLTNVMEAPKVTKVVVNIGLGEALTNSKALESAQRDMEAITGQRPVSTKAKKSVAAFKVREGMTIGMMVTLRGHRMYEFLDRLINVALPRIRDFRGAPTRGFDGRGNYSIGFREQVMFPEIDFNEVDRMRGLQVTVVTTAPADDQARSLLQHLGFAFSREEVAAAV